MSNSDTTTVEQIIQKDKGFVSISFILCFFPISPSTRYLAKQLPRTSASRSAQGMIGQVALKPSESKNTNEQVSAPQPGLQAETIPIWTNSPRNPTQQEELHLSTYVTYSCHPPTKEEQNGYIVSPITSLLQSYPIRVGFAMSLLLLTSREFPHHTWESFHDCMLSRWITGYKDQPTGLLWLLSLSCNTMYFPLLSHFSNLLNESVAFLEVFGSLQVPSILLSL